MIDKPVYFPLWSVEAAAEIVEAVRSPLSSN